MKYGDVYYNYAGLKMTVVENKDSHNVKIAFENGYEKYCCARDIRLGKVKNPYHPSIYGVGYIGKGYGIEDKRRYSTWIDMLKRCYDPKYQIKYPSYIGCSVCKEWHNYQNFAKWYDENYYKCGNERMCLDKDILIKGNKVYSPETCVFVPTAINNLFVKKQRSRGDYPIGVRKLKQRYSAYLGIKGKTKTIGVYDTVEDAFLSYKSAKELYIRQVADEYKNIIPTKLYTAMINYEVDISD